MAEGHSRFEDELRALEREVNSQTYVEFVLMVKDAVDHLLKTRGTKGRTVNKRHSRFGPIIQRCPQAVKIMHMLGFVDMNANALTCFTDICKRSLERNGIRSVATIDASSSIHSDDPTIVVAHLAYFYFLRFMFLTLVSEWQHLMGHLAFQIKVAMDSIDLCLRKLALAQPLSVGHDMWKTTKEHTSVYLANGGDIREQLCDEMVQAANAITFEMRLKYSEGDIDWMVYMHLKKVLILETTKGGMISTEGIERYMAASCGLPREYLSEQYLDTVDKVRGKCLESLERPLITSEIAELNHTLFWQASNFLGHLCLPLGGRRLHRLERSDTDGEMEFGGFMSHRHDLRQLLQLSGRRTTSHENRYEELEPGHVLGHGVGLPIHIHHVDADSNDSDGEEKKDEGEKEKPDWDEVDEDESGIGKDQYQSGQSGDLLNHSESNSMSLMKTERIEEFNQIARTATSVKQIELLQQTIRAMIKGRSEERAHVQSEKSEFESAILSAKSQGSTEIISIMEAAKDERSLVLHRLRGEMRLLYRASHVADKRLRYLTRSTLSGLQTNSTFCMLEKTLVDHREEQPILADMMFGLVTDFLPSDLLVKTCRQMGVNVRPTRERRQDWVAAILRLR
ncbi:uncharacterized protein LOC134187609 isoform X2 [Corticium candelabrum]|uniref:uncharacterized protein LOC134187609 isoform X2 n=1 Tax=Corticium candelabrum TaxID=121492 RepID=UPI002E2682A5|nr:uncharacterized protein LOC134187609 isoform X2 [Corticium candelabrum]